MIKENIYVKYVQNTITNIQVIQMIIFVYNVSKICIQHTKKVYHLN